MENTKWKCDSCGQLIEKIEDGWVEWLHILAQKGNNEKYFGIRLVHHQPASPRKQRGGCQYDEQKEYSKNQALVLDMSLDSFVGSDGLMELLEMLAANKLPKTDIIELIKRLHIPNYEKVRNHFGQAISEGVLEPNRLPGFYFQEQIDRVAKWIDNNKDLI